MARPDPVGAQGRLCRRPAERRPAWASKYPSSYKLGRNALKLYKPGTFGWGRVTKELLPGPYAANETTAVKRVKDAVATYRNHRAKRNDPMDDVRESAFHLLGITEGLDGPAGKPRGKASSHQADEADRVMIEARQAAMAHYSLTGHVMIPSPLIRTL
jgi:hypothetical protein